MYNTAKNVASNQLPGKFVAYSESIHVVRNESNGTVLNLYEKMRCGPLLNLEENVHGFAAIS